MTIRAKLIFWFLLAALLPAVVITLFAAGEAAERFNARALEELQGARERGRSILDSLEREISERLRGALQNTSFERFAEELKTQGRIPDPFFAQQLNDELGLRFDFLSLLSETGIVISSLEWPVFAGKRDLRWDQLSQHGDNECVIGAAGTDRDERLALRILLQRRGMVVIGGIALDQSTLPRFRTSARTLVFLNDRITGRVIPEAPGDQELALELEELLQPEIKLPEEGRLVLPIGEFLVGSIQLTNDGEAPGELIFLYPRRELDEAVTGLWTTFFLAAAAGILLALILGMMISIRVASPLRELIYGFDLVALGDFSIRLRSRRKDELGEILTSFNRMADDLEKLRKQLLRSERLAAWQEVARKIAHEIKNPLSPIQISIETLRKVHKRKHPEFKTIFQESTQTILEEVEKIRHIVQEFSDFARMPEPSFQPTDLNEVVAKAVRLFRPQLGKVKLVERLKPVPSISADPEQLHRMLLNLVGNALEALESKGTLTISLDASPARGKRQAETARITVEDDGPGMEEEVISKLFTPYFTTKPEGSGLGLVIAQRIVEQHKGRLNVTSAPDKGTKIEVHLPT